MVLKDEQIVMEDESVLKIGENIFESILKYQRNLPLVDRLLITVACDRSD
jgi:hypothetical protein